MNLIYLALLSGLLATSFVHKSEAKLHTESIVGGTASTLGQNTYTVSIQCNGEHFCGGAILNNRHIITVAHCFIGEKTNRFDSEEYIVVAGVTNAHNLQGRYRVTREVAKIYIPREYNPTIKVKKRFADIAVLELKSDLGLNQFITNVVLPPHAGPHLTYENQQAVVCGYGDNWVTMRHDAHTNRLVEVSSGSYSYERKCAQVIIRSNTGCRNVVRNVMDSQLCGNIIQRSPAHPEGLCTGDSGDPLVIGNTIIGVVSSSPDGCNEHILPAIYTRVTSFIPFIVNAIRGLRTADMRLAKYEVLSCGRTRSCDQKVLVEQ